MSVSVASPTPTPAAPPVLGPDYSFIEVLGLGWLVQAFWALLLLIVGVILIGLMIYRLVAGWGVHPAVPGVFGVAALGIGIWWWIDSTNQMPPELRPVTSIGALVILGGLGFLMASKRPT